MSLADRESIIKNPLKYHSLLKNELDNAKITIKHQKEKLKSLDIENDKFRNEVETINKQKDNYRDR